MNMPSTVGYGFMLDVRAMDPLLPEIRAARNCGLNLFYCHRPPHHLRKGLVNVVGLAIKAYAKAVNHGKAWMLIDPGVKLPRAFRYPREIEVATAVAWPDGNVWVRIGILEGSSTSRQKAFARSTGFAFQVEAKNLTPVQKEQGASLAIALVAVAFGKPLPPYPPLDGKGRSARDLAREAGGFDIFLRHWR